MILFDVSVLAHAHDSASRNHEKAAGLVGAALEGRLKACISCQTILELYSVLTDPEQLARPYEPGAAAELCGLYTRSRNLPKIVPTEESYSKALRLAGRAGMSARKIFDCLLVATALENGVDIIYTEDRRTLEPFKSVKIIDPFPEK
jgi:predicted nucleic acid-binding protein